MADWQHALEARRRCVREVVGRRLAAQQLPGHGGANCGHMHAAAAVECIHYVGLAVSEYRNSSTPMMGHFTFLERDCLEAYVDTSKPGLAAVFHRGSQTLPPLTNLSCCLGNAAPVVSIRTLGVLLHRHRGRLPRSTPRATSAAAKRALHAAAALHHAARSPWFEPRRSGPPLACSSSRCRLCRRDAYPRTRIGDRDGRAPASRPEDCSLLQTCAAYCVALSTPPPGAAEWATLSAASACGRHRAA